MLCALTSLALAAPSPAALESTWRAVSPLIAQSGRLPLPTLDSDDFADLARGEIIKQRGEKKGEADRAIGVGWLPYSIDAVWIGVLDDVHDDLVSGLTETWLPGTTADRKVLYQHLDLPMPVSDRHWVIVIENTRALHAASRGGVWERTWDLDPRGAAALGEVPPGLVDDPASAILTPVNDGGWYLVPADGGVLVVYQVRTVIGGNIPDELVVQYAMSTLDELITHVGELAARAPSHYRAGHYAITRPDGSAIPTWP